MKKTYQWQGEPVKVEFGRCVVFENKEKPLYWYNYLVDISPEKCQEGKFATIPAIKIITDHSEFCIANHHAYGIRKLVHGGWPNHGHASLPIESFVQDDGFEFTEFDEKGYLKMEKSIEKWLEKKFGDTDDYRKLQAAKEMARKSAI